MEKAYTKECWDVVSIQLPKLKCVNPLKGLAQPHVSHYGEITLAGSRLLRSTLAAAPVHFAQATVAVGEINSFNTPNKMKMHCERRSVKYQVRTVQRQEAEQSKGHGFLGRAAHTNVFMCDDCDGCYCMCVQQC